MTQRRNTPLEEALQAHIRQVKLLLAKLFKKGDLEGHGLLFWLLVQTVFLARNPDVIWFTGVAFENDPQESPEGLSWILTFATNDLENGPAARLRRMKEGHCS